MLFHRTYPNIFPDLVTKARKTCDIEYSFFRGSDWIWREIFCQIPHYLKFFDKPRRLQPYSKKRVVSACGLSKTLSNGIFFVGASRILVSYFPRKNEYSMSQIFLALVTRSRKIFGCILCHNMDLVFPGNILSYAGKPSFFGSPPFLHLSEARFSDSSLNLFDLL